MELRLKISDEFVKKLKENTGIDSTTQLTKEAFAILEWAVSEVKKGRVIVSEKEDGSDGKEVVMPSLMNAKALSA